MKLSNIGASIVGLATGIGAILTVVEQWHNIEQWNKPSAPMPLVTTAIPIASGAAIAPTVAAPAPPAPSESALRGCYSGSVGSALVMFAQCGNLGPLAWGQNKLRICFQEGGQRETAVFQVDRRFLAQNGLSVVREHTGTRANSISGDAADLNITYSRTDTNAFGVQIPLAGESRVSCRANEGEMECGVQPLWFNYGGIACTIMTGAVQVSLAGE